MSCTTEQLMAENKKLKAENEKLKALAALGAEQVLSHHGSSPKDEEIQKLKAQHQIDMEEIMPLVTQVEEYEEMTEALAQYFSKIDQNACDVFNKLLPMWYGGDRAEIE